MLATPLVSASVLSNRHTAMEIDISLLSEEPALDINALLTIQPLAPLSMVTELPGSFYKTLVAPDKRLLCGLFENILGWHFSPNYRVEILNACKRKPEKSLRSTYEPLLDPYFEIEGVVPPSSPMLYNDLWKRLYRRSDAGATHAGGTINFDYKFIQEMNCKFAGEPQIDAKAKGEFLTTNIDRISYFYSTPTQREYVVIEDAYKISLRIDNALLQQLQKALQCNDMGYLGNSEGWVTVTIEKK